MGLPRQYPMHTYPYARDAEEEDYYRRVHYVAVHSLCSERARTCSMHCAKCASEW